MSSLQPASCAYIRRVAHDQRGRSARDSAEVSRELASPRRDKWQLVAGWFLTLSYAIGSPAYAIVEARTGLFSERFDYPPEFLYLVAGTQFACALVLFTRFWAPWSSAVLTVLALGAAASHFRIGSPLTSLPAFAYIVIQIWYGSRVYRQNRAHKG